MIVDHFKQYNHVQIYIYIFIYLFIWFICFFCLFIYLFFVLFVYLFTQLWFVWQRLGCWKWMIFGCCCNLSAWLICIFCQRFDASIGLALLICRLLALDLQHVLWNRGIAWFNCCECKNKGLGPRARGPVSPNSETKIDSECSLARKVQKINKGINKQIDKVCTNRYINNKHMISKQISKWINRW